MAVAQAHVETFDIGRTVKRAFGVIGANLVTFSVLSLVVALPLLAMAWSPVSFAAGARGQLGSVSLVGVIATLLYFIGTFVLNAGVVHGAVATWNGRQASVGECLSRALSVFFPLVLLMILMGLGIGIGFVLLIVPGVILLLMWAVAIPAFVVERGSVTGALGRSRQLTSGHRGAVFLVLLAFGILSFLIVGLGDLMAGTQLFLVHQVTPTAIVVSAVAKTIGAILNAAVGAAIYYELREIKEGIGPEALAAMFD